MRQRVAALASAQWLTASRKHLSTTLSSSLYAAPTQGAWCLVRRLLGAVTARDLSVVTCVSTRYGITGGFSSPLDLIAHRMAHKPLPGSPLPKDTNLDSAGTCAWQMLLAAEADAQGDDDPSSHFHNLRLLGVRVLGFLIKDLWDHRETSRLSRKAYVHLLRKVFACSDILGKAISGESREEEKAICKLGLYTRDCWMSPCNSAGPQLPARRF